MAGTKNEVYNRTLEYSPEATICVNKLEDAEQQRRIADKEGENHKRVLALHMSEVLGDNLRATWFQRGSSFVINLLGSVRSAVADKAVNLANTASNKAGDLGHKAAVGLRHSAEGVGLKMQEQAQSVKSTIADKSVEAAHNVSSFAQEKASGTKSFLVEKAHEYSLKLKDAVSSSFYKTLGSFSGRTNLTFALMEEEAERARRMNCSEEKYAIYNALQVAALIKGLNRDGLEPQGHHTSLLLEEGERSRRICAVKGGDKAAIDNAKAVSGLINSKFNAPIILPKKEVDLEFDQVKLKGASGAAM